MNKNKIKQKKLLQEIIVKPDIKKSQALINAGYNKTSFCAFSSKSFIQLAEGSGLTDKLLSRKLKQGLNAKRPIEYRGVVKSEYPDWANRHRYLETGLKIKGHLSPVNALTLEANDYDITIEQEKPVNTSQTDRVAQ